MGSLTKKDVEHVAKLAKLTLTSKEVTKFQKQLSKIVEYISELNDIDTSKVLPTSQTTGLENVFRVDEVKSSNLLTQDEALSGTEQIHNGLFVVKAVINKN